VNNVLPRPLSSPGDDHGASRRYKTVPGRAWPYGLDTHRIPVEGILRALAALYTALREAASWRPLETGAHATCSQLERQQVKEAQQRSPRAGLLNR
jgi:hypothetical protein